MGCELKSSVVGAKNSDSREIETIAFAPQASDSYLIVVVSSRRVARVSASFSLARRRRASPPLSLYHPYISHP